MASSEKYLFEEACVVFRGSDVNITVEGHKYLGSFIISLEGHVEYLWKKVHNWIRVRVRVRFVLWPTLQKLNRKPHMLFLLNFRAQNMERENCRRKVLRIGGHLYR